MTHSHVPWLINTYHDSFIPTARVVSFCDHLIGGRVYTFMRHVSWLMHMRGMTYSYVWHDSLVENSRVISFSPDRHRWSMNELRKTWLMLGQCDAMTHVGAVWCHDSCWGSVMHLRCVRHNSCFYWMTHSYVCHDSCRRLTWHIHVNRRSPMSHSYVYTPPEAVPLRLTRRHWSRIHIHETWLMHVYHDSCNCVTWLIGICHNIFNSYERLVSFPLRLTRRRWSRLHIRRVYTFTRHDSCMHTMTHTHVTRRLSSRHEVMSHDLRIHIHEYLVIVGCIYTFIRHDSCVLINTFITHDSLSYMYILEGWL